MKRIVSALVFALSCAPDPLEGIIASTPTEGPKVVFDLLARPLPEIPFPNDMATRYDADSPTGRRVNAALSAPTYIEETTRREFSLLDGWGTFAPITVSFSAPVDPLAIRAAALNDDYADDTVYVINLTTGAPARLDLGRGNYPILIESPADYYANDPRKGGTTLLFETYDEDKNGNGVLDEGEDTDSDGILDKPNTVDPTKPLHGLSASGNADPDDRAPPGEEGNDVHRDLLEFYERQTNTLMIRPVVPLEQRTTYAVVLTKRIKDPAGKSIGSPFAFVNHAAQTAPLQPLLKLLADKKIPGLTAEDVAFTWTFTTQSVTKDLENIRAGLWGEGPMKFLGTEYSPKLEPVTGYSNLQQGPEEDLPVYPLVRQDRADAENKGNRYVLKAKQVTDFIAEFGSKIDLVNTSDVDSLLDAYKFVSHIVIGSFRSPDFMDDPRRPTTDAVWRVNTDMGFAQLFQRPTDWRETEIEALEAGLKNAPDAAAKQRVNRFATRDRITFMLIVPKEINGHKQPFPVSLHSHGANSAREEVLAFGGHLAKFGIATIGINSYAHGLDIEPTIKALVAGFLTSAKLEPFAQAVFTGRGRDLDYDGTEDSGGDFWVADTFHARDGVRQTVVDYMQLSRVVRHFGTYEMGDLNGDGKPETAGDFDADGVPDIGGPEKLPDGKPNPGHDMFMEGISMGGIVTAVTTAVEPSILASVPIAVGGGLGDIAQRTDLGQVTNNVFPDVFGPLFITEPEGDGVSLTALIGGVAHLTKVKLTDSPLPIKPGDRVEIVNLNTDNTETSHDSALVGADRAIRLQLGGDRAEFLDDSPLDGGKVHVGACEPEDVRNAEKDRLKLSHFADCLVITVSRKENGAWKPVYTLDKFPKDIAFRGRIYPKDTPFVALARGFGFKRQSKTFRRFLTLAQTILEAGDPVNYAPHYFDPAKPLRGREGKPAAVLIIPTQGDMGVPINGGWALARAAGLLPYEYDAAKPTPWGMSANDVVIRSKGMEAVDKLRYYKPVADKLRNPASVVAPRDQAIVDLVTCETPEECDKDSIVDLFNLAQDTRTKAFLDDSTSYFRGFGGAPRLKIPLSGELGAPYTTRTYDGRDDHNNPLKMVSALRSVYPDVHGRHVFEFPNPKSDFDIGLYVINMLGAFLQSHGTVVNQDVCLHRDGYDRPRTAAGAVRVNAAGCGADTIPNYPVE